MYIKSSSVGVRICQHRFMCTRYSQFYQTCTRLIQINALNGGSIKWEHRNIEHIKNVKAAYLKDDLKQYDYLKSFANRL